MNKHLAKLDTNVFMHYNLTNYYIIPLIKFDISVLLNNIDDIHDLYNSICMHPDLTEDIIVSIIKKMDMTKVALWCKNNLHPTVYINKCWLITQEFCEKYKSDFCLTVAAMINNCLPVKYIIDTHGNCLNALNCYSISKYCTKAEFDEYCKAHVTSPSLENPNLTVEWYLECNNDINWSECASVRAELFTPAVIMKYKDRIPADCFIWNHYFNQFPVDFISANLQLKYTHPLCYCIDTFKGHPGGISWHTIDSYMSARFGELRMCGMITISAAIKDLPCWFVKKYKDILKLTRNNINSHVNYNFITRHINDINIFGMEIINIRSHYVTMLSNIIGVCEMNCVAPDLYDIISGYC